MHLNSISRLTVFLSLFFLWQCRFSKNDTKKEEGGIVVECKNINCKLNNKSVIVLLDNHDCIGCTEAVERIAHIMIDGLPKGRIILVLKNFDPRMIAANRRINAAYYDQILIEGGDINIESNLRGLSHFIIFNETEGKYVAYSDNHFREISNYLGL